MSAVHARETARLVAAGVVQRIAASLASGVLFALALPPYDLFPLASVAFTPLLIAVWSASGYRAMWYALPMALTASFLLLGVPQEPSYTLVMMPFLAFGALTALVLATARWLGWQSGWITITGVGAAGVLVEWIAAIIDFPYTVALALWRDVPLLWVASWTGVWGLSFLLWAVNAAVAQALALRRTTRLLWTVLAGLALLHGVGAAQIALAGRSESVRVAVIQSDSSGMLSALREAKAQGAQLAVLPETCCSEAEAAGWARQLGMWLVFGYWGTGNSAALASPDGRLSPPYYKMHPYGGEPRSWRPGDTVRSCGSPIGRLGVVICDDTNVSDSVRLQARQGVRLIAVPTYDPMTPQLALHHLHAASTTLRAAEHRVPLARSEYRLKSMVTDRFGRVLAEADAGETLAVADVPLGDGRGSFATRLGDGAVLLCAFWLGATCVRQRRRSILSAPAGENPA
ncbi:MAG: nitrilase-related carbon-nitrogen hydrolase [Armatimonadota bacterium]|nr:nitrilase-related carbon-nitrogen hydrolase [Armatimonadota bacterium]